MPAYEVRCRTLRKGPTHRSRHDSIRQPAHPASSERLVLLDVPAGGLVVPGAVPRSRADWKGGIVFQSPTRAQRSTPMASSTRSPDPVTLSPNTCRAHPRRQHLSHSGRWSAVLVPALAALSLLLAACSQSAPAPSAAQTTAGRHPSATAGTGAGTSSGSPVKVFFSKHPDSDRNSTAVFAVTRVASNPQVATYAIQQLLAGPSASETRAGYFTPLTRALTGPSTCTGPAFHLTLHTRA